MSKCAKKPNEVCQSVPNDTSKAPEIFYGKLCRNRNEQAQQKWYIEYYVDGKRKRVSNFLNRIKDYQQKLEAFNQLRGEIEDSLNEGTSINDIPEKKDTKVIPVNNIPVSSIDIPIVNNPDALIVNVPLVTVVIADFIVEQHNKGLREKTIQNYISKLKFFDEMYGDRYINQIFTKDIQDILNAGVNTKSWSNRTYNNAKAIYNSLFQYAIDCRYLSTRPTTRVKTKYCTKSEVNKAFSKEDFALIMETIKDNKVLSMVIKSIYYTCIRPKELMNLQIKHFDFERRTIFIPAHISKNKKDGYVHIDEAYYFELMAYYKDAPQEAFLFCNPKTLWGYFPYHRNRPYRMLLNVLKSMGYDNKGYTLYSTKHYSNIQRFLGGWSIAEIMKANRHASIQQTENYLRHLLDYVDVTKKEIPTL